MYKFGHKAVDCGTCLRNYSKEQGISYRRNYAKINIEVSQEGSNSFSPLSTEHECQQCRKYAHKTKNYGKMSSLENNYHSKKFLHKKTCLIKLWRIQTNTTWT